MINNSQDMQSVPGTAGTITKAGLAGLLLVFTAACTSTYNKDAADRASYALIAENRSGAGHEHRGYPR